MRKPADDQALTRIRHTFPVVCFLMTFYLRRLDNTSAACVVSYSSKAGFCDLGGFHAQTEAQTTGPKRGYAEQIFFIGELATAIRPFPMLLMV